MDARDILLMTPLHWAVERGNVHSMEVIIIIKKIKKIVPWGAMGAQRGVILDGHTVRSYRHSKLSEEVVSCLCMVQKS